MKHKIWPAALALSALIAVSAPAQAPATPDEQRLLALIKEVQDQQAQMASNQTKLESKLAEVAEAVRVARIFAGRGGK